MSGSVGYRGLHSHELATRRVGLFLERERLMLMVTEATVHCIHWDTGSRHPELSCLPIPCPSLPD